MPDLKAEYTKFSFNWGSASDPAWEHWSSRHSLKPGDWLGRTHDREKEREDDTKSAQCRRKLMLMSVIIIIIIIFFNNKLTIATIYSTKHKRHAQN